MSCQVRAEYDFEAQAGSGEMSIIAGEILTVIRDVLSVLKYLVFSRMSEEDGLKVVTCEAKSVFSPSPMSSPTMELHLNVILLAVNRIQFKFKFIMLFASGLRKAVDQYDPCMAAVNATAEETAKLLNEKRRRQMIRRHTCSTLKPDALLRTVTFESAFTIKEDDEYQRQVFAPSSSVPPSKTVNDDWGSSTFMGGAVVPSYGGPGLSVVQTIVCLCKTLLVWCTPSYCQRAGLVQIYQLMKKEQIVVHLISKEKQLGGDDLQFEKRITTIIRNLEIIVDHQMKKIAQEHHNGKGESIATSGHGYHDSRTAIIRSQSVGGDRHSGSKINRNINRFSNFVKSGMESYVLGESKMNGQPGEKHEIIVNGSLVQWMPVQQYYTCTVDKPKKETKLKGLKSFIAYSLTSSLSKIEALASLFNKIMLLLTQVEALRLGWRTMVWALWMGPQELNPVENL
uniref:t-SNARE coiled-coil homology domain-containing protein n=1 Tax=Heterorhabditis bacteriophora TaxID=37862 RepID=A0A1I7XJJ5_HETBA